MADDEKLERISSGPRVPSHPLEEAIGFVKLIKAGCGSTGIRIDTASKALGYKNRCGPATNKVGALTHFGLLSVSGKGEYRITELAEKILSPCDDREDLEGIREAAQNPRLFSMLIEKYNGQPLPTLLPNILYREFNIPQQKAKNVSNIFKATLQYAEMLRDGVVCKDVNTPNEPPDVENSAIEKQSVVNPIPLVEVKPDIAINETVTIPIMLPNFEFGTLTLRRKPNIEDIDRIIREFQHIREELLNELSEKEFEL